LQKKLEQENRAKAKHKKKRPTSTASSQPNLMGKTVRVSCMMAQPTALL
jgi:hypothetical protein